MTSDLETEFESTIEKDERRMGRRRKILFGVLFLFALLVLLAPTIVGTFPLRHHLVSWATSDIKGKVGIGRCSIHWFSPLVFNDVTLVDENQNVIATVAEIRTSKSLLGLLASSNLGEITIQKPHLDLSVCHGTSNIEQAISALLESDDDEPSRLSKITINVVDGSAQVKNETNQQMDSISELNGTIELGGEQHAIEIHIAGIMPGLESAAGKITVSSKIGDSKTSKLFGGSLSIEADKFPLRVISTALARLGRQATLAGIVSSNVDLSWNENNVVGLDIHDFEMRDLRIDSTELFGKDTLTIERMTAGGSVDISQEFVEAENLRILSDFGSADAQGKIEWSQLNNFLSRGEFLSTDFEINGRIDLVRLAKTIPDTLRVKDGITIEAGELIVQSFCRPDRNDRRILLNVEARNIQARQNGNPIRWQAPVRIVAAMRQSNNQSVLEDFQIQSSSIDVRGHATREQGSFSAKGDFDSLMREASQFFDFEGIRIAGTFDGQVNWKTENTKRTTQLDGQPIGIDGGMSCRNAQFHWPGIGSWDEPQLQIELASQGVMTKSRQIKIPAGTMIITSGSDQLRAELTKEIVNPNFATDFPLHCKLTGSLKRWLARLDNFLPQFDFETDGELMISGRTLANFNSIRVSDANYTIENFVFDGYGLSIQEPEVQGEGTVKIDWSKYQFDFDDLTLSSSSVSARALGFVAIAEKQGWNLNGDIAFRADVNRVSHWMEPATSNEPVEWFGLAQGNLQMRTAEDRIDGRINGDINGFRLAKLKTRTQRSFRNTSGSENDNWNVLWSEPKPTLESIFSFSRDFGNVRFDQLKIVSKAISLAATGSIDDLFGQVVFDLSGNWQPDWNSLNKIIKGYAQYPIEFQGQQTEAFSFQGPMFALDSNENNLVNRNLKASTSLNWESGNVYGLPIGAGSINANLNDSFVSLQNSQIKLAGGALNINSGVNLQNRVPILVLRDGNLLEDVQLMPEICNGWLKYLSPVLAQTAQAQGRFSLHANGVRLPLNAPWQGKANGKLMIEEATISAGPLGRQLTGLAIGIKEMTEGRPIDGLLRGLQSQSFAQNQLARNQNNVWMRMPKQEVEFRLDQQRIYNKGVTFDVAGTQIQTSGNVGMDQSIDLVAEVVILDKWIKGKSWLAGLKNSSIKIPITGSISQPRFDQRGLRQLSSQLIQNAGSQRIRNELSERIGDVAPKQLNDVIGGVLGGDKDGKPAIGDSKEGLQNTIQEKLNRKLGNELDKLLGPKK